MRVSDGRIFEMTRQRLANARERATAAQERASSGLRVSKPSDDPVASARARTLTAQQARSQAQLRSATSAGSSLAMADSALSDAGGVLSRLKELAVQARTGTLSASDRQAVASEVTSLRGTMLTLANTQAGGHYLFAGSKDGSPPFDAAGVYSGDSTPREVEVAPSLRVPLGISGDVAFGAAGGTDVIGAIDAFAAALAANDTTGIGAGIASFDGAITQIADARATVGASMSTVDLAVATVERIADKSASARADLVEIDQTSAILDFLQAQQAVETATTLATKLSVGELARLR